MLRNGGSKMYLLLMWNLVRVYCANKGVLVCISRSFFIQAYSAVFISLR